MSGIDCKNAVEQERGVELFGKLKSWLGIPDLETELREELLALQADYELEGANGPASAEIRDRFYRDLEFGTAGMRGIMGAGTNRMNVMTVRRASQGFAEYLNATYGKVDPPNGGGIAEGTATAPTGVSIAIAYDNRKNSDRFAFEAACVFVANGIETHLFDDLSATPLLSFAVRELNCTAGIVITASHNGKRYNGYKIYDETGCQCLTDEAERVAAQIASVDLATGIRSVAARYAEESLSIRRKSATASEPLLHLIPTALEKRFVDRVLALLPGRTGADTIYSSNHADNVPIPDKSGEGCPTLNVVYTPLNGTGAKLVPEALSQIPGVALGLVEAQMAADPEFSTCPEPNPEKEAALSLGLTHCREKQAAGDAPDLLIASDPDCDRVGIAVYDGNDYVRLSGNQVGVLLLDYILETKKERGQMPDAPLMVTTIVSTPLASALAASAGVEARKVLTGFKYIGEILNGLAHDGRTDRFLLGFEESCGYLSGDHVRDKDGVNAASLICEMAADYKRKGKTLLDRLAEIAKRHGHFVEELLEFAKPGEQGMAEIAALMAGVRKPEAKNRFSAPIAYFRDYETMWTPGANVVEFAFADGSAAIFRPSGTEPKLKVYLFAKGTGKQEADIGLARLKSEVLQLIAD